MTKKLLMSKFHQVHWHHQKARWGNGVVFGSGTPTVRTRGQPLDHRGLRSILAAAEWRPALHSRQSRGQWGGKLAEAGRGDQKRRRIKSHLRFGYATFPGGLSRKRMLYWIDDWSTPPAHNTVGMITIFTLGVCLSPLIKMPRETKRIVRIVIATGATVSLTEGIIDDNQVFLLLIGTCYS